MHTAPPEAAPIAGSSHRPQRGRIVVSCVAIALAAVLACALGWCVTNRSDTLLRTAHLQVLHADGSPAEGIPVWISWTTLRDWRPLSQGRSLVAGADGVVSLDGLVGEWAIDGFRVQGRVLGGEEAEVLLEPRTVITLPPVGRVVLRLRDGRGATCRKSLPNQKVFLMYRSSNGRAEQRCAEWSRDGVAEFDHVICGNRLVVIARVHAATVRLGDARDSRPTSARGVSADSLEIDGPESLGATREVDLVVPDAPRAHGRVVDASGEPVQGVFGFGLRYDGCTLAGFTLETDAAGEFEFLLSTPAKRDGEMTLSSTGRASIKVPVTASPAGDLDAGDVRY